MSRRYKLNWPFGMETRMPLPRRAAESPTRLREKVSDTAHLLSSPNPGNVGLIAR